MTKKALAAALEISYRRTSQLIAEGMPDNLPAAIRWRDSRRRRIAPGASIGESDPARNARSIDEIKDALCFATDYETVKILSEKLRGMLLAELLIADVQEMVRTDDAEQSGRRIHHVIKLAIAELASVAPRLVGIDAATIHSRLMDHGNTILEMMADRQSPLWNSADVEFPIGDERLT